MMNLKQLPTKIKNSKGIILIEVLISMVIFTFGVLGLVGLQMVATQNSVNSQDRTIAANSANEMVSLMWLKKTSNVASAGISGDIAIRKAKVSASPLSDSTSDVTEAGGVATIVVSWKAPSKKNAENRNRYETSVVVQ